MRKCTVCTHLNVEEINKAIIEGESIRDIAKQFSKKFYNSPLSSSSIERHKRNHLPTLLVKAEEVRKESCAEDLFAEIRRLRSKAESIALMAEEEGDYRTALSGIRELIRIIELMAKLRGELQEQASINIIMNPQWISMRNNILSSLEEYPEARIKIAEVLTHAE